MKKTRIASLLVGLLVMFTIVLATGTAWAQEPATLPTAYWVGETGAWDNPDNWNSAPDGTGDFGLPGTLTDPTAIDNGGTAEISEGITAIGRTVFLGQTVDSGGHIVQTGGSFRSVGIWSIGEASGSVGSFDLSGGMATAGDDIYVGNYGTGTLTVSSGLLEQTGSLKDVYIGPEDGSIGTLNISGDGSMTVVDKLKFGTDKTPPPE